MSKVDELAKKLGAEINEKPAPKIFAAMNGIMADVGPITKGRTNQSQNYKFRGIDDVYEALQAVLAKHQVFTTSTILDQRHEERTTAKGTVLIYRVLTIRWTFWAIDGSNVSTETIGEGMDSGDKASNKAMSVAHKYAFIQAFSIPTVEPKDPENDSHDIQPKNAAQQTQPLQPQKKAMVYDDADAVMRETIETALKNAKVEKQFWPAVRERLKGKLTTDLRHVVAEVTSPEARNPH